MEEYNRDPKTIKNKRKETTTHKWRLLTSDEKNKRTIHNKPYTWNGKNSWVKDNTPDSGLKSPADIASAATIAILGRKIAAAAIAAAAMAAKPTTFSTSVVGGDDPTALTFLTQDQLSEMARFQANIDNLGTKVSQMTSYLGGIDFTLWMIFNKFVSFVCTITTTTLFCFIEQVIEPYCTTEVSIAIISGFFWPRIAIAAAEEMSAGDSRPESGVMSLIQEFFPFQV